MRNSVVIVLMTAVMVGCKPTVPSEYIQPGELEDILYDYHVSQAMAREAGHDNYNYEYKRNAYFKAVLKKYDVTEAVFDSSLVYYYSHAERLKTIYLHVAERLNDDAKVLGASVGDIGRYSQYSESGDTANIWKYETDMLLMFQFLSDFIYQSGQRDAYVCLVAQYEDSLTQTVSHVTVSGQTQVRIPHYRDGKLKELNGFIILNNNDEDNDVRKLLFISQIQLIRFHHKEKQDEPKNNTGNKTDSLPGTPVTARRTPDTTSHRDIQRSGGPVLSLPRGAAVHRVDMPSVKPAKR